MDEALKEERFRPTEASRRQLLDLSLTTQAKAALLANPTTCPHQLSVSCKDGHMALSGAVRDEAAQTLEIGRAHV